MNVRKDGFAEFFRKLLASEGKTVLENFRWILIPFLTESIWDILIFHRFQTTLPQSWNLNYYQQNSYQIELKK
ncbi:MAG TPA: hypothetical protein DCZ94_00035 [Lentisphaeria bacterium]|nr:MAG: hypothetical protein A2X48_00615 [Lentisphaerae bacterium GWF2_49_21]HBC85321.1 hypothetical protein [Lentisphaeria bacterium]